ncbi:MAG: Crp/Fnr family transcriptional regulator [Brevinematales bacterium]|nr:Crp/Fnr family transcriptional regulator [Brevinematales bacterium]
MFIPWHLSLFEGISEEEKQFLFTLPWREKFFSKGDIILQAGVEYTTLWILTRGECRAIFPSGEGEPVVAEILHAPVVIASAVLFAHEPFLPVNVEAIKDGSALLIEKREWEKCLGKCDTLRKNFLREVADKLVILTRRMVLLQLPVEKRVLSFLTSVYKGEETILLPMTIEQLAHYLCVARQVLCRVFRRLEDKKYLIQQRRVIILKKRFFEEWLRTSPHTAP